MVARRNRQQRQRRRSHGWIWKALLASVLLAVLGIFLATSWMRNYLRSDAFRDFLNVQVSKALHTSGEFDPFEWNGSSVYSESYRGRGLTTGPFEQLTAQGLRAGVDFGSFRREAWEIDQVTVNRLTFVIGDDEAARVPQPPERTPASGFWSRFIPQGVDIGEITVADASFVVRADQSKILGKDSKITLAPLSGSEGWSVHAEGGSLVMEDWPKLMVNSVHARLHDGGLFVTDAGFRFHDSARMQVNGELRLRDGELRLRTDVDHLSAEKVFQADWRQRLLGTIHADVRSSGRANDPTGLRHSGRVWMKNGVLMALPVLDRIATHTRTERFRRLVLDEASAEFSLRGKALSLHDLSMRADGLTQVTGYLNVHDPFQSLSSPKVDGVLEVGVVHGVLKWLPGAEKKVFTRERDGYLWTTMRVQGTLAALEEDLSPRLTSAAVTTTVEAVPEKGFGVGRSLLDGAAGVIGGGVGNVLRDTGGTVLDTAEEVVGSGLRFVPMLVAPKQ